MRAREEEEEMRKRTSRHVALKHMNTLRDAVIECFIEQRVHQSFHSFIHHKVKETASESTWFRRAKSASVVLEISSSPHCVNVLLVYTLRDRSGFV